MLTTSLWPSAVLCNGATGTVVDFIYHNNLQPPSLPIAVTVKFDEYEGPSIFEDKPNCVPICALRLTDLLIYLNIVMTRVKFICKHILDNMYNVVIQLHLYVIM